PAVEVEVGHGKIPRVRGVTGDRVAERAVDAARPDDHLNPSELRADVDLIEDAVAGEVRQERGRRPLDPRWRLGVASVPEEAGRETVFQDFEVGPMRHGSRRARSPLMTLPPARRQGG